MNELTTIISLQYIERKYRVNCFFENIFEFAKFKEMWLAEVKFLFNNNFEFTKLKKMWLAEIKFLFDNNFEKIKCCVLSEVSKLNKCVLQKLPN